MPATRHVLRRRDGALDDDLRPGDYRPLARGSGWGDLAHAVVCCPRCGSLSLTVREHFAVDFDGHVCPSAACSACKYAGDYVLADWVPEPAGSA